VPRNPSGVGARSRARLWMAWSGARRKMSASAASYADQLRFAGAVLRDEPSEKPDEERVRHRRELRQHVRQIELDLERTFPNHSEFRAFDPDEHEGTDESAPGVNDARGVNSDKRLGSKLEPLRRVLTALAHAVPDVGYTQGMNFVCGWCLLVLENSPGSSGGEDKGTRASEERAFWLMRCLLEDILPGYFEPGFAALRFDLDVLDDDFMDIAPDAHAALETHGLNVKCLCPRLLLCVLVGTAPTAVTLRAWDVLLVDAPGKGGESHYKKAMPSLRFRPRDVLRRCALTMLTSTGRARGIAGAQGAAEAVDTIRSAGRGIVDVQTFLRSVRDLAPGSKPASLKAVLGSTVAALSTAAAAATRPISRLGSGSSSAMHSANTATTPPRRFAADDSSFASRPALTPFGNLLSAMRATPARELVKPRALWEGGDGREKGNGRKRPGRERRGENGTADDENGIELDGGCGATPSRRRVTGVNAMASWTSPPARSPMRPNAVGYGYDSPLATRSYLARMR